MVTQPAPKSGWERYFTELFETNPELQKECEQVKNAVVYFSKNHTPSQLDRFIDAWGSYDARTLAHILNVPEKTLQEFFRILLKKLP